METTTHQPTPSEALAAAEAAESAAFRAYDARAKRLHAAYSAGRSADLAEQARTGRRNLVQADRAGIAAAQALAG